MLTGEDWVDFAEAFAPENWARCGTCYSIERSGYSLMKDGKSPLIAKARFAQWAYNGGVRQKAS
jgi:hypothetical protein